MSEIARLAALHADTLVLSLAREWEVALATAVAEAASPPPAEGLAAWKLGTALAFRGRIDEGLLWLAGARPPGPETASPPSAALARMSALVRALLATLSDRLDESWFTSIGAEERRELSRDAPEPAGDEVEQLVDLHSLQVRSILLAARPEYAVSDASRAIDVAEARAERVLSGRAGARDAFATRVELARTLVAARRGERVIGYVVKATSRDTPITFAWTQSAIGRAALRKDDLATATERLSIALESFRSASCLVGMARALRLLSRVAMAGSTKHPTLALRYLNEALCYETARDSVSGEARTLAEKIRVYHALGAHDQCALLSSEIRERLERVKLSAHARGLLAEAAGSCAAERARESARPGEPPLDIGGAPVFWARSAAAERVRRYAERIAPTLAPVLIRGETGTGKSLLARYIHERSPRRHGPFVEVNCAALPEALVESELFGHEKGAFTGATARTKGKFELADGGTIFLDEIGDLSLAAQVKILHALEAKRYFRVGGATKVNADVRIVAATNRDLRTAMMAGSFRDDLFYRLAGAVLHIPALRERVDEIPLLAATLLQRIAAETGRDPQSLSPRAYDFLRAQPWMGNVRELTRVLEASSALAEGLAITVEALQSVYGAMLMGGVASSSYPPAPALDPASGQRIPVAALATQPEALTSDRMAIPQDAPASMTSRQLLFLHRCRPGAIVTVAMYQQATGCPLRTATRDLAALVECARLRAIGQGPARRYVVVA